MYACIREEATVSRTAATASRPDSTPNRKLTYEEFLAWNGPDRRIEWVRGEVSVLSPVSDRHADLVGFLSALIRHFVEAHDLGIVRSDLFQIKTAPDLPGRIPDVLFLAREHLTRLRRNHLAGPADLAIEVISPDDPDRDRVDKLAEYQQGGVREFWLLDPELRQAAFYRLDDQGRYQPMALDENGRYHSVVLPGLWLEVGWLWQEPLPRLLHVLREWGLV